MITRRHSFTDHVMLLHQHKLTCCNPTITGAWQTSSHTLALIILSAFLCQHQYSPLTNFFISGVLFLGISDADYSSCKAHDIHKWYGPTETNTVQLLLYTGDEKVQNNKNRRFFGTASTTHWEKKHSFIITGVQNHEKRGNTHVSIKHPLVLIMSMAAVYIRFFFSHSVCPWSPHPSSCFSFSVGLLPWRLRLHRDPCSQQEWAQWRTAYKPAKHFRNATAQSFTYEKYF